MILSDLRRFTPGNDYLAFSRSRRQSEEFPLNAILSELRKPLKTLAFTKPNRAERGSLGQRRMAVQRRILDPAPVSEVRACRLNAFETKRKRPPTGASSRVRYRIMAEGVSAKYCLEIYSCAEYWRNTHHPTQQRERAALSPGRPLVLIACGRRQAARALCRASCSSLHSAIMVSASAAARSATNTIRSA